MQRKSGIGGARRAAVAVVIAAQVCAIPVVMAQDHVNPHQAEIDANNDRKALLTSRTELAAAEAARYPALPEGVGKEGTLSVETAERDKFHVTARAADAYDAAATKLAEKLAAESSMVLLSPLDRSAILFYVGEKVKLERLVREMEALVPSEKKAEALGVLGAVALLTQVAQLTKLFRTDKSLAFTDASLPDDLFLDLLALKLSGKLHYPGVAVDAVYSGATQSLYANTVKSLFDRRQQLVALTGEKAPKDKKERASALLADMETLATTLVTPDATTKLPGLMTIMRGELASGYMEATGGRALTVHIASKGGSSLKTSSFWRSDRLYAAGGVIVSYRLTGGDKDPKVLKAGVVTAETGFVEVPLKPQ